jgi:hypothetical protein
MVDTISYMSTVDAGDFSWEEAVAAAVVTEGSISFVEEELIEVGKKNRLSLD